MSLILSNSKYVIIKFNKLFSQLCHSSEIKSLLLKNMKISSKMLKKELENPINHLFIKEDIHFTRPLGILFQKMANFEVLFAGTFHQA